MLGNEEEAGCDELCALPELDSIGMLALGPLLETGGTELPISLELRLPLPLGSPLDPIGRLEDGRSDETAALELAIPLDGPGTLEAPGTLDPGNWEELTGGSDSEAWCDDENGGKVPVPAGNELLFGTVTIRLEDHDGRSELEDPIGLDADILLPGRLPILLEDTGTAADFVLLLGTPTLALEDSPGGTSLPDAGMALLPRVLPTLDSGGTIVDPEGAGKLDDGLSTSELEMGTIEMLPGGKEATAVDEEKLKCLLELGRQEKEYPVPVG